MKKKGVISPLLIMYGLVLLLIVVIVIILSDAIKIVGPPNPDDISKLPGSFEPAGSKIKRLLP